MTVSENHFSEMTLDDERISHDFSASGDPLNPPTDTSAHILIIGAGVTGLTTAWALLDAGFRVTVISKEWASHGSGLRLTSQIAGALWELPPAGCGPQAVQGKLPMVQDWALESFAVYRTIAARATLAEAYGVKMKMFTSFHLNKIDSDALKTAKMQLMNDTGMEGFARGTHLFAKYGVNAASHGGLQDAYEHLAPIIDTDVAMSFLMRLVRSKGARFETDTVHGDILAQEDHLLSVYGADAIVNATGVWAGAAAADDSVYPMRGGVLRVVNDGTDFPKLENSMVVSSESKSDGYFRDMAFIVPRNDNILLLGSLVHRDAWALDLSPASDVVQEMRARCEDLLPMLKNARVESSYPFAQGMRPMRESYVRVELEERKTCRGQQSRIVHSYGHGGAGWSLAFGSARQVLRLVNGALSREEKKKKKMVCRDASMDKLINGVNGQRNGHLVT
ncbi:hypothetical protein FE257_002546 [Aspergillus nanangensis]|uniref:FAD dependent oxidoreductase domain-containing protein n=1 Tax=Aspergillus nanangensis TaxID=2582783 RepID=A0AAD4CSZ5_ASPNN|nr:hypothetical protein FE257_002546 [Aspergillus nanangensis]